MESTSMNELLQIDVTFRDNCVWAARLRCFLAVYRLIVSLLCVYVYLFTFIATLRLGYNVFFVKYDGIYIIFHVICENSFKNNMSRLLLVIFT